jgi:hypothetical protein
MIILRFFAAAAALSFSPTATSLETAVPVRPSQLNSAVYVGIAQAPGGQSGWAAMPHFR